MSAHKIPVPEGWTLMRGGNRPRNGTRRVIVNLHSGKLRYFEGSLTRQYDYRAFKRLNTPARVVGVYVACGYRVVAQTKRSVTLEKTA